MFLSRLYINQKEFKNGFHEEGDLFVQLIQKSNAARRRALHNELASYSFVLPGLIFLVVYMAYPLVYTFYLSLTKYKLTDRAPKFIGFENYIDLFADNTFLLSLKNTAVFAVAFFVLLMVLSLLIALLLDRGVRGSGFFRTSIFLPVVVPMSLSGVVFTWILNENYGLVNYILNEFGLGIFARNWLSEPSWAMFSILLVSIWKNMGILVILYMAGLGAISNDIIEASKVDGASVFRRIISIVLPNLKESFVVCGIWAIMNAIKVFEQPFVMTKGGPANSTMVLYLYTWQSAFKFLNVGYAAAIAYVMGICIMIFSLLNMYLNRSDTAKEKTRPHKG